MKINTNRENIGLEQTLTYIKYINKEKPFDREEILIPTRDYQEVINTKQKTPMSIDKKKIKQEEQIDEDLTKKINKNRAIKRIIQSAFEILQNFSNYEEGQEMHLNEKSSEIQFNIYLKQFNRVLELIHKRETQKISIQAERAQEREQILQNIFQYTVVQDFREVLPTATLKDKISKTNVEIMIDKLNKSLVVLKPNQLRIYDTVQQTSSFKSIKLHQIENVDYHTQPYIFIVLTIQKDKERFNIYLQFQSEKNQEKWDRALYCCYIGRKMRTKEKFFLIQYPEEDVKKKEKEQTKKQAAFHYEITEKRSPFDRIYNQKNSANVSEHSEGHQPSENLSRRSNTKRHKQSIRSPQQTETLVRQQKSSDVANPGSRSHKLTNNEDETNRLLENEKKQKNPKNSEMINRNKTDYININKDDPPVQVHTPHQKSANIRHNLLNDFENEHTIEKSDNPNDPKEGADLSDQDYLPEDIKQIHNLQRKNVKGLVLEKEKFFFNKSKIVFLKESSQAVKEEKDRKKKEEEEGQFFEEKKLDIKGEYQAMKERQLQYWDFDSRSGDKTQCKVIKVVKIKRMQMNEETRMLIINHDKEIIFTGDMDNLMEIYNWIDQIQCIYREKLGMQL